LGRRQTTGVNQLDVGGRKFLPDLKVACKHGGSCARRGGWMLVSGFRISESVVKKNSSKGRDRSGAKAAVSR